MSTDLQDPMADTPPERYRFGHLCMGPILAECCLLLHRHLTANAKHPGQAVLFCARGGLLIRRALKLFVRRIEEPMPYSTADFMVSRLAAARLAIGVDSGTTPGLLALEFEGRTCADAASALSDRQAPLTGPWSAPYEQARFLDLLSGTTEGKRIRAVVSEQASFLRAHFRSAARDASAVHLVDTGVFGSIAQYLQAGIPDVALECVLLFQAHYKRPAHAMARSGAIGLVCDFDDYRPWEPRSVTRLYWPFFEAFFEPPLPSIRRYGLDAGQQVVSNLEIPGWRELADPTPGSMIHGAFHYLARITPGVVSGIRRDASAAWRHVRRRVIYPSATDLALMGVRDRGLDFGSDELVQFGHMPTDHGLQGAAAAMRNSVWLEGELRRQFPRAAGIGQRLLELQRAGAALTRLTAKHCLPYRRGS